jgi:hypothetical protein
MIEKEVYEPRQQEEARNQDIYDFQAEPFRVCNIDSHMWQLLHHRSHLYMNINDFWIQNTI